MDTNIVSFLGSSMPKIMDDRDSGFLAFVLVNGLKVLPSNVRRRAMLDMNNTFIANILSNKMLSIVVSRSCADQEDDHVISLIIRVRVAYRPQFFLPD